MANKMIFKTSSDSATSYLKALDYAKYNPYFSVDYFNSMQGSNRTGYAYNMAALNKVSNFRQNDFNEDTYNALNSQDGDAGYSYLMYKAANDKDEETDANFSALSEHYAKISKRDSESGWTRFWSGAKLAVQDASLWLTKRVDNLIDVLPNAQVTIDKAINNSTGVNSDAYHPISDEQMQNFIDNDYWYSWATGGKTINEMQYDNRINRFYETKQFNTIEDAVNGFNLTDRFNLGNALDFIGQAAGSILEMSINFLPGGSALYWSYTGAQMFSQTASQVEDPYLRLAQWGQQFAVEYATEMIFADSFLDKGLIKTDKWLPSSVTGFKRFFAEMGIEASTNAIEEMASQVLDTLVNQGLYSTEIALGKYGSLSETDKQNIDPQWNTALSQTIQAGIIGAVVGAFGVVSSVMRTKAETVVDDSNVITTLNKVQTWSVNEIMEKVSHFTDSMYARNKVLDNALAKDSKADLTEVVNSEAYAKATVEDEEYHKEYINAVSHVAEYLKGIGYSDTDSIMNNVNSSFESASQFYHNFITNGYTRSQGTKAAIESAVNSGKIKHKNVLTKYTNAEESFSKRYDGKFNFQTQISSYTDSELSKLAMRSGYDAIYVGTFGSKSGKANESALVTIDNNLFINTDYYSKNGGTRNTGLLRQTIVERLVNSLTDEAMFKSKDNKFYEKVVMYLRGDLGGGNFPYTRLVQELGIKAAHKKIVSAFLNSPVVMRLVFTENTPMLRNFAKTLANNRQRLVKELGKGTESAMAVNSQVINIVNNAMGALSDIGTYNPILLRTLDNLVTDAPIDEKINVIADALTGNKRLIDENSKVSDVWLLRDLGFLGRQRMVSKKYVQQGNDIAEETKINYVPAIKKQVISYLESINTRDMLFQDKVVSPLLVSDYANLSDKDVAQLILQSPSLRHYLGVSSENFRLLFLAHCQNVISSEDVDTNIRSEYMAMINDFVKYSFALDNEDTKQSIGSYMHKLNADYLANIFASQPSIRAIIGQNVVSTPAPKVSLNDFSVPFASKAGVLGSILASQFPSLTKSIIGDKVGAEADKAVVDYFINGKTSILVKINALLSNNQLSNTDILHGVRDILSLSDDERLGISTNGEVNLIASLFFNGDVANAKEAISSGQGIASRVPLTAEQMLFALDTSLGIVIDTVSKSTHPVIFTIANLANMFNLNATHPYAKMSDATDANLYVIQNIYDTQGKEVKDVSTGFDGHTGIKAVQLTTIFDTNKYLKFLIDNGTIDYQTSLHLKKRISEFRVVFAPKQLSQDSYRNGWYDQTNKPYDINVIITDNGTDVANTLMHETFHALAHLVNPREITARDYLRILATPAGNLAKTLQLMANSDTTQLQSIIEAKNMGEIARLPLFKGKRVPSVKITTLQHLAQFMIDAINAGAIPTTNNTIDSINALLYVYQINELVANGMTRKELTNTLGSLGGLAYDSRVIYQDVMSDRALRTLLQNSSNSAMPFFSQKIDNTAFLLPEVATNNREWLTKEQLSIIADVNSVRETIINSGAINSDQGVFIHNLVTLFNSAKTSADFNQVLATNYNPMIKVLGSLRDAVNSLDGSKITGKIKSAETTKPVEENKTIEKAPVTLVKETTNIKPGNRLTAEQLRDKNITVKLSPTKDSSLHNVVSKVVQQGGELSNGQTQKAIVRMFVYSGSAKELNITRVARNYTIKGAGIQVAPEARVALEAVNTTMYKTLKKLTSDINLDDVLASPKLKKLSDEQKSIFAEKVKSAAKEYYDLQVKLRKPQTEEGLNDFIVEATKQATLLLGKVSSIRNEIADAIANVKVKELKDKEQAMADKHDERIKRNNDLIETYNAKTKAMRDALTAKRKLLQKQRNINKISNKDNVTKIVEEAQAHSTLSEYALLEQILTGKITTTDELQAYVNDNLLSAKRFYKFLEEQRGYTDIQRAMKTVLDGDDSDLRPTKTPMFNAFRSILLEAHDRYDTVKSDSQAVEDFLREYNSQNLRQMQKDGSLDDYIYDEISGITSVLDRLIEHDTTDVGMANAEGVGLEDYLINSLAKHGDIYDETGKLTEAGKEIRDAMTENGYVGEDTKFPESYDVAQKTTEAREKLESEFTPYHLDSAELDRMTKTINYVQRTSKLKLTDHLKNLLTIIFNNSKSTAISEILVSTKAGVRPDMVYNTSNYSAFVKEYGKTLDELSPHDWLLLAKFIHHMTIMRKVPSEAMANVMNLSNYFIQGYMANTIGNGDIDANRAYNFFELTREPMVHVAATILALNKVAKKALLGGSGGNNIADSMRQSFIEQRINADGKTPEEAMEEADKLFQFKISLAEVRRKLGIKAIDEANAMMNEIRLMLRRSGTIVATRDMTVDEQINQIMDGVVALDSETMSSLYSLAQQEGNWRMLLFIQNMYKDKAREMIKSEHFTLTDLFSPKTSPARRKAAWDSVLTRLVSYRYLAMLSNPSVFAKNALQNRLNSLSNKTIIDPLVGKFMFKWLNKGLGKKITTSGQKNANGTMTSGTFHLRDSSGNYVNLVKTRLTEGANRGEIVWSFKNSTKNALLATTYSADEADGIAKQFGTRYSVDNTVEQLDLSKGSVSKDAQAKAEALVKNMFVDSGYMEYMQNLSRMGPVNERTLDKYLQRNNPFHSTIMSSIYLKVYNLLEGDDVKIVQKMALEYTVNIVAKTGLYELPHTAYGEEIDSTMTKEQQTQRALDDQVFKIEMEKVSTMALISSLEVVYKSDNKMFRAIEKIFSASGLTKFLGSVIIPFPRVSSNMLIQIHKFSPFGLGQFVFKALKIGVYGMQVDADNTESQMILYQLAKDGVKGMLGTALYSLGFLLAGLGIMKLDTDKDYHGFVLTIGDVKIDISNVASMAYPIIVGAAFDWTHKTFPQALESAAQEVSTITFLGNVFDTFNSYNIADIPEQLVDTYVLSYIPAILKTVYKNIPGSLGGMYEKSYAGTNALSKLFLEAFPIFAPNKIDPFTGEDQLRYAKNFWFLNALNAISPLQVFVYPKTDAQREAERLGETTGNRTTKTAAFDGTTVTLTEKQLRAYNRYKGKAYNWVSNKIITSSAYKNATDEQKAKLLASARAYASQLAKVEMWLSAKSGNSYKYVNTTDLTNILRQYLRGANIQKVKSLPKTGTNFYGTW